MKWVGILVIIFGFLFYVGVTAFERSLPLVQFVVGEQVASEPMHILLPPNTQFVKGTGSNGAKFVDIHSDAANYIAIAKYLGLAKLGGLAMCVLGAVGFAFERWREKTKREYELSPPDNADSTEAVE